LKYYGLATAVSHFPGISLSTVKSVEVESDLAALSIQITDNKRRLHFLKPPSYANITGHVSFEAIMSMFDEKRIPNHLFICTLLIKV
jgi:hypothetical protein